MQTIRLNVEALEVKSFTTTNFEALKGDQLAPTDFCGSAVSETNGVYICKSCGPCCV
jgi:hypothetical protein